MSVKQMRVGPGAANRGSVLVVALCLLLIMTAMCTVMLLYSATDTRQAELSARRAKALFVAQAGLEAELAELSGLRNVSRLDRPFQAFEALAGQKLRSGAWLTKDGLKVGQYDVTVTNVANIDAWTRDLSIRVDAWVPQQDYPGAVSRRIDAVARVRIGRGEVFDYVYFINNWGWYYGDTILANGNVRANGQFDGGGYGAYVRALPRFRTCEGTDLRGRLDEGGIYSGWDIIGASNMRSDANSVWTAEDAQAGRCGPDDVGYLKCQHPYQEPVPMPNLNDLTMYEDLAKRKASSVKLGTVTVVQGVLGDDPQEPQNLFLHGTKAEPIVLEGPVVVRGTVVISGEVTGQGAIYSKDNIYITSDLKYKSPPSPLPAEASETPMESWLAQNQGADAVGLYSAGQVVIGNYSGSGDQSHGSFGSTSSSGSGSTLSSGSGSTSSSGSGNTSSSGSGSTSSSGTGSTSSSGSGSTSSSGTGSTSSSGSGSTSSSGTGSMPNAGSIEVSHSGSGYTSDTGAGGSAHAGSSGGASSSSAVSGTDGGGGGGGSWSGLVSSWMNDPRNRSDEDSGEDFIPNTVAGRDGVLGTADDDVLEGDGQWTVETYTPAQADLGLIPPEKQVGDPIPGTGEDINGNGVLDGATQLSDFNLPAPMTTPNWAGNLPLRGAFVYGWSEGGVSASVMSKLNHDLGVNTAVIAGDCPNGGLAASLAALPTDLNCVVQPSPLCLVFADKSLPDQDEAKKDIDWLAARGVRGIVIAHESGLNHPQAQQYLSALAGWCKAAGVEPVGIACDPVQTAVARAAGLSVWRQFFLNQTIGGRAFVQTDQDAGNRIRQATDDLATEPRGKLDAILIQAVGFRDYTNKVYDPAHATEWLFPTPDLARLQFCLDQLGDYRDHCVFWQYYPRDKDLEDLREYPQHCDAIRNWLTVPASAVADSSNPSDTITQVDAAIYTNNTIAMLTGAFGQDLTFNGCLVSRNEAIVYGASRCVLNYDLRLLDGAESRGFCLPRTWKPIEVIMWRSD